MTAGGNSGGKLKRQATTMKHDDIKAVVANLKKATYEEKEKVTHLIDVLALHSESNPASLVSAGAIKPLVQLITSGTDGAQVHAASALATIAASPIPEISANSAASARSTPA